MRKQAIFIGIALIFMMLALLTGIFRLMADNALYPGILGALYGLHPIMMVFGFLASIVMAERVAGIAVVPGFRSTKPALLMVPLIGGGVLLEMLGYAVTSNVLLRYLGGAFLAAGCITFLLVLIDLSMKSGVRLPFYFMLLSVVSLLAAGVSSAFRLPAGDVPFIMLLLSFPMIFILGERVELTRFVSSPRSTRRFETAFGAAIISVATFVIASLPGLAAVESVVLVSLGLAMLFLTLIIVLSAEVSNFKLLSKSIQPLQRYVSVHTRVGYAWGLAGVIFGELYLLAGPEFGFSNLYDAFIHSLAVGFIGTMLLAHGPVILPSVTGRKLARTDITRLPLFLLTLGNLIRVSGDLLSGPFPSTALSIAVGLSGWLVLASVVLFLPTILSATKSSKVASTVPKIAAAGSTT